MNIKVCFMDCDGYLRNIGKCIWLRTYGSNNDLAYCPWCKGLLIEKICNDYK